MPRSIVSLMKTSNKGTKLMIGVGLAIVSIIMFLIFFSYAIAPYNPNEFVAEPLIPPCSKHLMGTDALGRDVLSRTLCGTTMSMSIAFIAIAIALTVGTSLGAVSGYLGGAVDKSLSFVMDSIWILPTIVIAMLIVLVLGRTVANTSFAIALVMVPRFFRVIRSITLVMKNRGFIDAQRAIGANWIYIITYHIAPFYVSSLAALASLGLAAAVLSVSGLGFLGLGVPPPTPEWGTDLSSGRQYILTGHWWLTSFPGAMIFLSAFGFNLLSEGIDNILKTVRESRL